MDRHDDHQEVQEHHGGLQEVQEGLPRDCLQVDRGERHAHHGQEVQEDQGQYDHGHQEVQEQNDHQEGRAGHPVHRQAGHHDDRQAVQERLDHHQIWEDLQA